MIKFDEATHRYFDGEKELISVTSLMRKHGLSPDYSAVRSDVLKAAAERGTLIHKEIDDFINKQEYGFTREVKEFAEHIKFRNCDIIDNEFIVNNDICAGTADLLLMDRTGFYIIAEIKTTAILHRDAASWQLSIYNYLDGCKATKGQAFHFNADGRLNVVDIPLKPNEEVERLFECERNDEIYTQNLSTITEEEFARLAEIEKVIAEAEATKKSAEAQRDELKAAIMAAMERHGVKTFENEKVKLTHIAPSTRTTIDTTRLKAEQPAIAEQYAKTNKTKANLKITIKE